MRRINQRALRLFNLVDHMDVWLVHLRRLEAIYIQEKKQHHLVEVRHDIKKLREWREKLDALDTRTDRKGGVSKLQSGAGGALSEPKWPTTDDTPVLEEPRLPLS